MNDPQVHGKSCQSFGWYSKKEDFSMSLLLFLFEVIFFRNLPFDSSHLFGGIGIGYKLAKQIEQANQVCYG